MAQEVAMQTLRDVMTRNPIVVAPNATLREVVDTLCEYHVSGVPVVSGSHRLLGVISVSDVIELLASTSVRAGAELPVVPGYDGTPEPGEPAGAAPFFTEPWSADSDDGVLDWDHVDLDVDLLGHYTAEEVMTRRVVALGPEATVQEAARLMLQEGIHRMLVVENATLVGVVTTKDLIRIVARGARAPQPAALNVG
jgi:predicted transcriptional regulator